MIDRYANPKVLEIWDDLHKLWGWAEVELALLQARHERGELDRTTYTIISEAVLQNDLDVEWWKEDEKATRHDLNSAVKERKRFIPDELRAWYHKEATSYDSEETALLKHLLESIAVIEAKLDKLEEVLKKQALRYRYTVMMGVTHGQWADVQSFGKRILAWYCELKLAREDLDFAKSKLHRSKMSGFVGNYTGITPDLEKEALAIMGFEPYIGSTQILPRVMFRRLASALGGVSKVLAGIALDLRLGARSASVLYQEPFGAKQMGSSAGPQKRNTITWEQTNGLDALIAGFEAALHAVEVTWEERAIEQSCVERVVWPDLFHTLCRMLDNMVKTVESLKVYPQNMMREIIMTNGTYAASVAKERLKEMTTGLLSDEECYRIVQLAAFNLGYPEPDQFVPNSIEQADEIFAIRSMMPLEPEARKSIRDVIMQGQLAVCPILAATEEDVASWNEKLLQIFSSIDNRMVWMQIFTLKYLLRNEDYLFEQAFGV